MQDYTTMAEAEDSTLQKFTAKIGDLDYEAQCRWFLNAFWEDLGQDQGEAAEEMWKCCELIRNVVLDQAKGSTEHALDEFGAARLWEEGGEPLTRNARVAKLKKIDVDNDKMMSLWEYFFFKWNDKAPFKGNDAMWAVNEIMSRPQGTNEELANAKKVLDLAIQKGEKYTEKGKQLEKELVETEGKTVKHNRAKMKMEVWKANDIFSDADFNKEYLLAKSAVRRAAKGENKTCQGDLWWVQRTQKETEKYKKKGNLKR